ncbi:beta-hexosaminidase [Cutibacterium acnes JCM 18916]|nr:beta-hexosaminidase [Cutibacterium acnes JCM 18916]GAE76930.1 beta-hexosaminidase [Cutibacterium acnes JCM 18918]GAE79471.1 beta-hexosaminidase [Cutibacterium acnes JCM 18920]
MSLWRDDPGEVAHTIAMGESRRCDRRRLSRQGDTIDRITTGGDVMRTDLLRLVSLSRWHNSRREHNMRRSTVKRRTVMAAAAGAFAASASAVASGSG